MATLTTQEAIQAALRHHQAGQLAQAEGIYRQILTRQPDNADALHFLGLLAHQVGRHDAAADLIGRAIAIRPNYAEAHTNLGNLLRDRGQLDKAIAAYRQAIALGPHSPEAYNNLANALSDKGQLEKAVTAYQRAIALKPDYPKAHSNLGAALAALGQLDEAIGVIRHAIALKPEYPEAYHNLAGALIAVGRLDEAIATCRQAITLRPESADALGNLGAALKGNGQLDEAIAACRRAIALRPNSPEAYINLGAALAEKGQPDEAIAACRQAIVLRPNSPQAYNNLGNALKDRGQLESAIAAYREAIAIKPSYVVGHSSLICTMHFHSGCDASDIAGELRRWDRQHAEPLKKFIRPHANDRDPDRRLHIGYVSPDFRDHVVGRNILPLIRRHDQSQFEVTCYSQVACPDGMTGAFQQSARRWRNIVGLSDEQAAEQIRRDEIDVLVDLTLHMAYNRLLVFARKPAPVQVTFAGYPGSTGLTTIDYRLSDPYLDPARDEDRQINYGLGRELSPSLGTPGEGGGGGVVKGVARNAPSLTLPRTTEGGNNEGIRSSCANHDEPPDMDESVYSEKTIRLPDSFWCYDPLDCADISVNSPPALQTGILTFGSFNNFCKVTDATLGLWAQVLRQVEGSRLLLMAQPGSHRQRTVERMGRDGIDAGRVEFVSKRPRRDYLALHHGVDIGLDTFPYNGHTTSLDSFWMGVPVVTLVGRSAVARAGWCQLSNLGLTELSGQTPDQFVRIAVELARDLPRLTRLRATLRERMEQSPLMDAPRFARNIEAAYRGMWRTWCSEAAAVASD